MEQRMDYYKFTHYFLPHTVFNFPEITIGQILENKEKYAEKLKIVWKKIELEDNQQRSIAPNFSIDLKKINDNTTLIVLKIPEAPYIGIVFDKEFNIRYFTYEVGKDCDKGTYHLCEWSKKWNHSNYGINSECSTEQFVSEVRRTLNL
jgi:hypothetical protein